jgi:hypothetical protein
MEGDYASRPLPAMHKIRMEVRRHAAVHSETTTHAQSCGDITICCICSHERHMREHVNT